MKVRIHDRSGLCVQNEMAPTLGFPSDLIAWT